MVSDLYPATSGSAALDLSIAENVLLTPAAGVQKLPTGVYGPIPKGTVGLIIGRSSCTLEGVKVHLGVVDEDYQGHIQIMVSCQYPYQLAAGDRIAQLLLLPYVKMNSSPHQRTGGFGSTNSQIWYNTVIQPDRPTCSLIINGKSFSGLIDTGADVSVIARKQWPSAWPLKSTTTSLSGVGSVDKVHQSRFILNCQGPDGQQGTIQPYVLDMALNLWGRDLLSQWGAFLHIPQISPSVKNIM